MPSLPSSFDYLGSSWEEKGIFWYANCQRNSSGSSLRSREALSWIAGATSTPGESATGNDDFERTSSHEDLCLARTNAGSEFRPEREDAGWAGLRFGRSECYERRRREEASCETRNPAAFYFGSSHLARSLTKQHGSYAPVRVRQTTAGSTRGDCATTASRGDEEVERKSLCTQRGETCLSLGGDGTKEMKARETRCFQRSTGAGEHGDEKPALRSARRAELPEAEFIDAWYATSRLSTEGTKQFPVTCHKGS
ncbi:hypothetical protein BC835DRAFT_1303410 [Cytidiella melzeri]|nr:hypothetical protein BC835DRAFT_1303410 [Cytidiella melzeri]